MSKSRDSLAVAPNADGAVKPPTDEAEGIDLRVAGMDCASCAAAIESAVRRLDGVRDVQVDVVGGRVRVRHAEEQVKRVDIASAIRSAGYRVESDVRGSGVEGQ